MQSGNETEEQTLAHFRAHGWMRVACAIDGDAAMRMRESVWRALAKGGMHRDRPETWKIERRSHLQHLKNDPAFRAVGSEVLSKALDAIFEGRAYAKPKDWGGLFIAFPSDAKWCIPVAGWHIDANYASGLWPTNGVKTFALFGDVWPRGGGTLIVSGSHRLVHAWFRKNPPPHGARSADMRRLLQSHPYVRDLHSAGPAQGRIARFMDRVEVVDGVPLRIVKTAGAAGDVFILHPLVLHVAAPNKSAEPRFLLSGGITTDMWGWAPP